MTRTERVVERPTPITLEHPRGQQPTQEVVGGNPSIQPSATIPLVASKKMPTYDIETHWGSTPISVFKLLFTSPKHAEAFFAVLSQAQLPRTVPAEDLLNMIWHINNGRPTNHLLRWRPERRQETTSHTEALLISALTNDYKINRVLVDNGAGVHIFTLMTANQGLRICTIRLRTGRNNHQRWLRESEIIQRNHLQPITSRTSKETYLPYAIRTEERNRHWKHT